MFALCVAENECNLMLFEILKMNSKHLNTVDFNFCMHLLFISGLIDKVLNVLKQSKHKELSLNLKHYANWFLINKLGIKLVTFARKQKNVIKN